MRLTFTEKADQYFLDLLILRPANLSKPAPAFVGLNFHGNHTVLPDPAILLPESPVRDSEKFGGGDGRPSEAGRGQSLTTWSAELLLEHGFALVTAYCGDLDPDFHDCFRNGVHPLLANPDATSHAPDAWGTIGAWAWGLSRMRDYLETRPDIINLQQTAVIGHSRLGKTALWAAANDERFGMAISAQSGCGGAALSKRNFGEHVARINSAFPHWFCGNFRKYGGAEDKLPFDQHMLIALLAPRPVFIASTEEDKCVDATGEFLAAKNAQPAYELLGKKESHQENPPETNVVVGETIGYYRRQGKHEVNTQDWHTFINFANKQWQKKN